MRPALEKYNSEIVSRSLVNAVENHKSKKKEEVIVRNTSKLLAPPQPLVPVSKKKSLTFENSLQSKL